jgi:hypothetical protein
MEEQLLTAEYRVLIEYGYIVMHNWQAQVHPTASQQ